MNEPGAMIPESPAEREIPLRDGVARMRALLERTISPTGKPESLGDDAIPATLQVLTEKLGLSPFERDIVMLCAACELDADFPALCARAQSDARRSYPTFMLAARALPEADVAAFTPQAPLRHMRLIEIGPGESLMASALRIDERILHFLCGVNALDERLAGMLEPAQTIAILPASYRTTTEQIIRRLRTAAVDSDWPLIEMSGDASPGKTALASIACAALGLRLLVLRASQMPSAIAERDAFLRLWERELVLGNCALLIDMDAENSSSTLAFCTSVSGVVFVSTREALPLTKRAIERVVIDRPPFEEQRALWSHVLGAAAASMNGELDAIVADFPMDPVRILRVGSRIAREIESDSDAPIEQRVRAACRLESRPSLGTVAQRVRGTATWNDIVLPDFQSRTLREIVAHVRHRSTVYERWGFGARANSLGVTALFAGPSGTGKTLAAEVLAHELQLDLWRIDLSQVVSKYVGETEKNLKTVFDAADEGGALLLFDEADALFGRRSEVRDSHDRLANIEVSYLLQRMESYRGLAILTTNMRGALDPSFLRRIRFVVSFPFPDTALRARIWERVFPAGTPVESIDVTKLARLNLTGANIRNIALNAAFLAADSGEPVRMHHLLQSAGGECSKLEKPLTQSEVAGWV